MRDKIKNTFIRNYLTYVSRSSEAPDLFHLWSVITTASALSARSAWLDLGHIRHYPNLYTILVGPSSVRKSSAIKIAKHLITEYSFAKFAPTDTAGARQGLLAAMRGEVSYGESDDAIQHEFSEEQLNNLDMSTVGESAASELYVCSEQFASFLGQKQFDLIQCLSYCYKNPDEYSYKLKTSEEYVKKPTIQILAAAAPETLYSCLPSSAMGTKFLSCCIMVYAGKGKPRLARPKALSAQWADDTLKEGIRFCRTHRGGMIETPDAAEALDDIYETFTPDISDSRFINYIHKRHAHLVKTVICLALLDGRDTIKADDVFDAQYILSETETHMPDALGEYGLNPVAVAKQRIIEILTATSQDTLRSSDEIYNLMNRDVKKVDFTRALEELHTTDRVMRSETRTADGSRTFFKYGLIQRLSKAQKALLTGKTKDWSNVVKAEEKNDE